MVAVRTIGAYSVLRKIGEGGMGAVYLGEHTLLGRRAAIKVLLPELSANETIVKRFFNEARAVTQIADPGIVQVFDFGYADDGGAFIVMELLEGESLGKRLKRVGRLSPSDTLRLMRMICTSLAAAHAKGIIHRDLKPDNLFIVGDPAVTGGERPKILDFGIAKLSGDPEDMHKTNTGVLMGTPVYMSPEQCRGAGGIDHRSDIYAIGCVMFRMITGHTVFRGAGSGDIIASHLREAAPFAAATVPDLPDIVDVILQRCLQKDPDRRYQSMHELADAIAQAEHLLHHASQPTIAFDARATPAPQIPATPVPMAQLTAPAVTAPPVAVAPSPVVVQQPQQRQLIVILIAAIVAVGIMIAVALYVTRSKRTPRPAAQPPADAAVATPATAAPDAAETPATTPATTPVDAAVEDAHVPPDSSVDAGMIKRRPNRPAGHGTKPPTDPDFDRGN